MRIFLIFCALAVTSPPAWADKICRQTQQADFGSAVSSYPDKAFVITDACEEPKLAIHRPVPLSVRIGQYDPQETVAADDTLMATVPPSTMPTKSKPINGPRNELSTWTVWFDLDRAELTDSSKATLDTITSPKTVRVTGYTCPLGSERHNLDLSLRRAKSVNGYLQERGVSVIAASGRGECCPISADNLAHNRRAVIQEEVKETSK